MIKPLLFFCAGNVQQQFQTPFLSRIHGLIRTMPWTGSLFLMGALAITGTPPFSIFQSEFLVLSAAFAGGHAWLAALFVLCVVTIFAGFLYHMVGLNLGAGENAVAVVPVCPWKTTAMACVAVLVVVTGFGLPGPVYQMIERAAQIAGGIP